MIYCACCDDDRQFIKIFQLILEEQLSKLALCFECEYFVNPEQLLKKVVEEQKRYDLIFLDIDMPEMNGKELAGKLRLYDSEFLLVFLTSLENEMLNTYQYDVSDYIPKSLLRKRIYATLPRLLEKRRKIDKKEEVQFFRIGYSVDKNIQLLKIPLDEIMYFEVLNRKVQLITVRGSYELTKEKFSDIRGAYLLKGFIDIHRLIIVNIKYIYSVKNNEVILDNGTTLPLSRRKREAILTRLTDLVNERKNGYE